ncbi:acyl-CoA dehydrogenase family protein [Mycolicibacter hiberniae]|uniref:Acyl-CoA dehydrogenase n=1 Tax=Mycolicibacter hiberniae TaxID=29314 RepID=A0A7I7WXT9_9MYCO|nr:acyl-CoA dehydrogenase family protein [Mycolicibacter hiberniae]MCV7087055.1 acyl-CoA dehydrogenase family protein [Mycolicibacter hiberniae]ORV67927.1 acyl-CoA dehydrogenase [Mycolicibacter hiberniae]BBZ21645.1 acyl-CoA dehydrogenase [Mycolicibacter hiberniae]
MDFELTDEQRGIVDSTRSLLATKFPVETARNLIDTAHGFDPELWRRGTELGWPALGVAEDDGGLGQQTVELALVAAELGRGLGCVPFLPVVVAADALGRSDHAHRSALLPAICAGTVIATWAFAEFGRPWSAAGITTRAQRRPDGFTLTGSKVSVQDADSAQVLIVDAALDTGPARFVVPADAPGIRIERQQTLDVTRSYCDVRFDQVRLDASSLIADGDQAQCAITRSLLLATALTCAEMVGIGERLLAMTTEYVKDRVQFGRPVGSFQAVKHKCANMRIWSQASTAATYYAAMALDAAHPQADRAVSIAKAYVSDAVNRIAGEALQLHGGIGFTWEHDLHLYLRRARVDAMLSGDATHHRELLCQSIEAGLTTATASA